MPEWSHFLTEYLLRQYSLVGVFLILKSCFHSLAAHVAKSSFLGTNKQGNDNNNKRTKKGSVVCDQVTGETYFDPYYLYSSAQKESSTNNRTFDSIPEEVRSDVSGQYYDNPGYEGESAVNTNGVQIGFSISSANLRQNPRSSSSAVGPVKVGIGLFHFYIFQKCWKQYTG